MHIKVKLRKHISTKNDNLYKNFNKFSTKFIVIRKCKKIDFVRSKKTWI